MMTIMVMARTTSFWMAAWRWRDVPGGRRWRDAGRRRKRVRQEVGGKGGQMMAWGKREVRRLQDAENNSK